MCQQWFSVTGLIFDAAGFLLIAFEWRHVFQREHETRIDELEHDSERHDAKLRGKKYEDPRRGNYTMWREFQRLFLKEWRFRQKLFYAGVTLVVVGFMGQVLGSWPYHLTTFGLRSC
ncbi:MAG: hypothetical protein ABSD09_16915 [Xanthobacteraceae bacterium]|jgi:hypothetical protein